MARFVEYVQKLARTDPGRRAALRSGLGRRPETAPRMHAIVARWIRGGALEAEERAYYTVASLIAAQSRSARADDGPERVDSVPESPVEIRSLGESLGLATRSAPGRRRAVAAGTAEKRLHLLTRQGLDGLHRHLPAVVRQVREARPPVPVDWRQLLVDLWWWPYDHDRIAKRWLQDYYRIVETDHDQKNQEPQ